jgi:hypothetical protein
LTPLCKFPFLQSVIKDKSDQLIEFLQEELPKKILKAEMKAWLNKNYKEQEGLYAI